jgi:hypothetical protein
MAILIGSINMSKRTGTNSEHDANGDGNIDSEEIKNMEKLTSIENADKKEDAQRKMAWVAIGGMVTYPLLVIGLTVTSFDASILASMADLYFISVAGIVAAFYGKEAYMSIRKGSNNNDSF